MADVLDQTLRAASGVVHTPEQIVPLVTSTPGTAANLKDGNDATGSMLSAYNEGSGTPLGNLREEWGLDICTTAGAISFVRMIARCKRVDIDLDFGAGNSATYRPSIGGLSVGTVAGVLPSPADIAQNVATDPVDGLPWTAAKVNARKFGWYLTATAGFPTTFDEEAQAWTVDFKVEVWVPEILAAIDRTQAIETVRLTQTLSSADIQAAQQVGDARVGQELGDVRITQTLQRDTAVTHTVEGGT
jgi:hypothetical protein